MQASDIESLTRTIQMKEDLIKVRCCAGLGEFPLGMLQRSLFVPHILRAVWVAIPDAIAAGLPAALRFLWPEGKGPKPPDCSYLVFCSFCAKHPPSSRLTRVHPSCVPSWFLLNARVCA